MSPPRFKWIMLPLLAVAGIGLAWWISGLKEKPASPTTSGGPAVHSTPSAPPVENPLASAIERWGADKAQSSRLQSLADLRQQLASMPNGEASAAVRAFLASGQDKSTGLSFEIAADGSLKEWPTFRTFLLDALLTIDPTTAAAVSREILATPTAPDEWALALRNVGRVEDISENRDFLRTKTEELIQNPAWQANPSVGYLNAFDVLVHTKATESTPLLSSLIQNKERKDLAHAGFLTLDRLVQQAPADMLEKLTTDRALQQSRPEMTAQQFARADLRDPAQQALVKSWLLSPSRSAAELNAFVGTYPNNNQFVSNNLLTSSIPHAGYDLAAHDRAALEILKTFQSDPAFKPVAEQLATMIQRLTGFTGKQTPDAR